MKINYKILIILVIFITSIAKSKAEIKYIYTVDLSVKILKISNKVITYEYLGEKIESKFNVSGYFVNDTKINGLKSLELNQDYLIQLVFPVNMKNSAMKNLGLGMIRFIGVDAYPV